MYVRCLCVACESLPVIRCLCVVACASLPVRRCLCVVALVITMLSVSPHHFVLLVSPQNTTSCCLCVAYVTSQHHFVLPVWCCLYGVACMVLPVCCMCHLITPPVACVLPVSHHNTTRCLCVACVTS